MIVQIWMETAVQTRISSADPGSQLVNTFHLTDKVDCL
jgi:hypothetical protein